MKTKLKLLCGAESTCGCVANPTQLRMAGPQPEVGKRGRISGLSARSDLNGKLGDVIRWIPNKDRWAIVVVDSKEKVLVRKDCIDFDYTDGNAPTPSIEGYTDAGPAMPVAGPDFMKVLQEAFACLLVPLGCSKKA